MITDNDLIESLEINLALLKGASMLSKPKMAEQCVNDLLIIIKRQNDTIRNQTRALVEIKGDIDRFKTKGFC